MDLEEVAKLADQELADMMVEYGIEVNKYEYNYQLNWQTKRDAKEMLVHRQGQVSMYIDNVEEVTATIKDRKLELSKAETTLSEKESAHKSNPHDVEAKIEYDCAFSTVQSLIKMLKDDEEEKKKQLNLLTLYGELMLKAKERLPPSDEQDTDPSTSGKSTVRGVIPVEVRTKVLAKYPQLHPEPYEEKVKQAEEFLTKVEDQCDCLKADYMAGLKKVEEYKVRVAQFNRFVEEYPENGEYQCSLKIWSRSLDDAKLAVEEKNRLYEEGKQRQEEAETKAKEAKEALAQIQKTFLEKVDSETSGLSSFFAKFGKKKK